MRLQAKFSLYAFLGLVLTMPLGASAPITPEMKAGLETVIKSCESAYNNTKNLITRFDQVKKPSLFSSLKTKKIYKELPVNKKAFTMRMEEFSRLTNEKINLRLEKSPEKLRDKVAAYSSNCSRFSAGLAGFVEWATTGEGPAGFSVTYNDWKNEALKEMKK